MLPESSSSYLFDSSKIGQYFFYKKRQDDLECDFKPPLSDELALTLLDSFSLQRLLVMQQNHTSNVACYPSSSGYSHLDAVMTDQKKVGLLVRHADCQAAFFYDPKKNVIAAVHAGFRGQVLKVYTQTLHKLKKKYGCCAKDLLVAISPSLGFDHAEFKNFKSEFPPSLHKYEHDGFMDLKTMAFEELIHEGVQPQNIDIDPRCTYGQDQLFYSYRKNKTTSRLASLIFLK
jgi:YfiH family protein